MKTVVQKVSHAKVEVDGRKIAEISKGFLVFLGVEKEDSEKEALFMAKKIANLRIMADKNKKMSLTVKDVGGEMLIVSQFTLCAETKGQNRPSFIKAAEPEKAKKLYTLFIEELKNYGVKVSSGEFSAYMKVSLVNDGPVTIIM